MARRQWARQLVSWAGVVSTGIASAAMVGAADLEHSEVDAPIGDAAHGRSEESHALEPAEAHRVGRERVELFSLLRWLHLVAVGSGVGVGVWVRVRVKD